MKQLFLSSFLWVRQQKYIYFLLLPILFSVFMYACKNESFTSIASPVNNLALSGGLISLSYEVEELHYKKVDESNGNISDLEKIAQIPTVTREKIQLAIFEDGSFERVSQKIEPQLIKLTPPNHQTPPDKVPKSVLTKIDRSGTSHFFDKDNNELYNLKLNSIQSYKVIIDNVKSGALNNDDILDVVLGLKKIGDLDSLINTLKVNGDGVKQLSDGILLFTHIGVSESFNLNPKFRTPSNYKTETLFDNKNKILLGSRTTNELGNEVFQFVPRYSLSAKGTPKVDLVHKELTDYDHPSKKVIKSITESYYANLNSQINLH